MGKRTLTLELDDDVYDVISARAAAKRRKPEREAKYILMRVATGQEIEQLPGVEILSSVDYLRGRFATVEWDPSWLERNAARESTGE